MTMPHKNSNTERYGGPGSSRQDRKHPEKAGREHEGPAPGAPTTVTSCVEGSDCDRSNAPVSRLTSVARPTNGSPSTRACSGTSSIREITAESSRLSDSGEKDLSKQN